MLNKGPHFNITNNVFWFLLLGIEYVYNYETKLFQKSGGGPEGVHHIKLDEKKIDEDLYKKAADTIRVSGSVKVARIWSSAESSLIRFQVDILNDDFFNTAM